MTALARAPTTPRSSVRPEIATGSRLPSWDYFVPSEHETNDAWRWPACIETSDEMVNDPQVAAIELAVTQPTLLHRLALAPHGLTPEWAELAADDLDLPIVGREQPPGRSPLRFSLHEHVARAVRMVRLGVQVFEIVGEIDDRGRWRLVDLQPIPPRTITRWDVGPDGRLLAVWQWQTQSMRDVRIPADHLAVYTWGGDAGDPTGRSMFRPLYRPWAAKDRLIRLDMIQKERNAMGVPKGVLPPDASPADRELFSQLLASMAVGEGSHVTLPNGGDFTLEGVRGTVVDPIASAEFHNKEMARATATMVLQAGDTGHGTYSTASEHGDYLSMVHAGIAARIARVLTVQALSRLLAWNGVDPGAVIVASSPSEASGAAERPAPVEATGRRARSTLPASARARRPVAASSINGVPVPDRRLRRRPTALEAASGVDFARIETDWVSVQEQVAGLLAGARDELAAVLLDAIRGMGAVDPLTLADELAPILRRAADLVDVGPIAQALESAAADGVGQVVAEADRQGATIDPDDVDFHDRAQLEATNATRRLAASLVETASTAALTGTAAGASGAAVAEAVGQAVDRLTDAQPELAASGMTSRAQNAGRGHALEVAEYRELAGSALLDSGTCGPCIDWDGRTFDSLDEAMVQYPGGGGNKDCEGGSRCRCVLVAVLATEQEVAT